VSAPGGFVFKMPWANKAREMQLNKKKWEAFVEKKWSFSIYQSI